MVSGRPLLQFQSNVKTHSTSCEHGNVNELLCISLMNHFSLLGILTAISHASFGALNEKCLLNCFCILNYLSGRN